MVHGEAVFNEVLLVYATNLMQFTAVCYLTYSVFNEMLVIMRIKMWAIKPEQMNKANIAISQQAPPYIAPDQHEAGYKEMAVMGPDQTTEVSVDGV